MGISIAIDDFGTGFSSLSYLNRTPADVLKIDRSFISDIEKGGAPIVAAIIAMARELGCSVVAEGVETERGARVPARARMRRPAGLPLRPTGARRGVLLAGPQRLSLRSAGDERPGTLSWATCRCLSGTASPTGRARGVC